MQPSCIKAARRRARRRRRARNPSASLVGGVDADPQHRQAPPPRAPPDPVPARPPRPPRAAAGARSRSRRPGRARARRSRARSSLSRRRCARQRRPRRAEAAAGASAVRRVAGAARRAARRAHAPAALSPARERRETATSPAAASASEQRDRRHELRSPSHSPRRRAPAARRTRDREQRSATQPRPSCRGRRRSAPRRSRRRGCAGGAARADQQRDAAPRRRGTSARSGSRGAGTASAAARAPPPRPPSTARPPPPRSPRQRRAMRSRLATTPSVACSASDSAHCGRTQCVSTHASCPAARSSSCSHPAARRSASVQGPRSSKRARPSAMAGDGGHGQRAIIPRPVASAAVTAATDPAFAGLARQAELIAAGEVSSRELTEAYLERIARLDPTLNAFRVVLRRARAGRGRPGRRPPRRRRRAPAARRPGRDQGRHRRRGRGHRARHQRVRRARARGRRGRAPPARRRRGDRRQDQRPRARDHAVHRVADVRRDPQPVGPQPHAGRLERRLGRRRSPPAWSAARSAPTAAARSASRPAAAACSASSRSAAGSRWRRCSEPWHGLSVYGPIARHVADAALFIDATSDGEPLAPAVGRAARAAADRALDSRPPPILGVARTREQRGALDAMASCCAASATRSSSAIPTTAPRGPRSPRATSAASPTRRRAMPHPERLSRRTKGFRRLGGAIATAALERAPRRARPPTPRAIATRRSSSADVLLTPMFTRRPIPIGTYEGRGALWSFNGYSRWVPYCARLQPHRPARRVGAGGLHRRRLPARRPARRPPRRRGDAALARRPDRGRSGRGRTAVPRSP